MFYEDWFFFILDILQGDLQNLSLTTGLTQQFAHSASCNTFWDHIYSSLCKSFTHPFEHTACDLPGWSRFQLVYDTSSPLSQWKEPALPWSWRPIQKESPERPNTRLLAKACSNLSRFKRTLFKRQHQKNTLWCLLFAVGSECVSVYVLYVPIGNGNKGRSIVLTGLPGLIKGKQIFSHPVTSWTVPLPALRVEQRI